MTQLNQIYRCNICGNITEVIHTGGGELVCCGQPMELLAEKTEDEGQEKHVPVIEETDRGVKVKVGSVPHPMGEKHSIEWIEILADLPAQAGGKAYRKYLKPGDIPKVEFCIQAENITARELCNVHGLWKNND